MRYYQNIQNGCCVSIDKATTGLSSESLEINLTEYDLSLLLAYLASCNIRPNIDNTIFKSDENSLSANIEYEEVECYAILDSTGNYVRYDILNEPPQYGFILTKFEYALFSLFPKIRSGETTIASDFGGNDNVLLSNVEYEEVTGDDE